MPDRESEDLERELRELAPRIKYPPTPDVSQKVRSKLDAEPAQRRSGLRTFARPRWIVAVAATILLSLTVLSPAIRSTVSGSMSSGAAGGAGQASGGAAGTSDASTGHAAQQVTEHDGIAASGRTSDKVPDEAAAGAAAGASAGTSAAPPPGSGLGLGERISSSEARVKTGELLLPEAPELVGEPVTFYARGAYKTDGVVVVFGPGPGLPPLGDSGFGLLLVEVPGDLESTYPLVEGASEPPEQVDVGGNRGYWLPDGRLVRSQPEDGLPGGALLWEQEDMALLMRANVTREEAVRIAGTIR